jgi:hypothetical protein
VRAALCRFDDFDGAAPAPDNTVVHFRALHAIPKGGAHPAGCLTSVGVPDLMAVGVMRLGGLVWQARS